MRICLSDGFDQIGGMHITRCFSGNQIVLHITLKINLMAKISTVSTTVVPSTPLAACIQLNPLKIKNRIRLGKYAVADDNGNDISNNQVIGKQGKLYILNFRKIQNKINDYRQHHSGNDSGGQGIELLKVVVLFILFETPVIQ